MNRITTVGELRALLSGLPDDATIRPAIPSYVVPQPGLYFIRFAPGTCNPAFVEVHIEPATYSVPASETRENWLERSQPDETDRYAMDLARRKNAEWPKRTPGVTLPDGAQR